MDKEPELAKPTTEQVVKAKQELKAQGTISSSPLSIVTADKTATLSGFWAYVSTPVGLGVITSLVIGIGGLVKGYIDKMPTSDSAQKIEITNWPKDKDGMSPPATKDSVFIVAAPGTTYTFKGVTYQLPVEVVRDKDGNDVEVRKIP